MSYTHCQPQQRQRGQGGEARTFVEACRDDVEVKRHSESGGCGGAHAVRAQRPPVLRQQHTQPSAPSRLRAQRAHCGYRRYSAGS